MLKVWNVWSHEAHKTSRGYTPSTGPGILVLPCPAFSDTRRTLQARLARVIPTSAATTVRLAITMSSGSHNAVAAEVIPETVPVCCILSLSGICGL